MTPKEIEVLKELQLIQETAVARTTTFSDERLVELAYQVSYETLTMLLELFDGCRDQLHLSMRDKSSGQVLFNQVSLHDLVADWLKT